MPVEPTLEFSQDPLSDVTPTWTDVSAYLVTAEWASGKDRDLDEPRNGWARFTLDNSDGRFTPEFEAGAYYPNIVPLRRFRLTVDDGVNSSDEGVFYVTDWGTDFRQDGDYHEVDVACVDGFGLLSLDLLPALDPPDATSYADVVGFDQPFGYWQLGETGTETRVETVTIPRKKKRRARRVTREFVDAAGAAGPEGVYQNRHLLVFGGPGPIVGDDSTAVRFGFSGTTRSQARIPMDATEYLSAGNSITVEAWVMKETDDDKGFQPIVSGPRDSGAAEVWQLILQNSDAALGSFAFAVGSQYVHGGTITYEAWHHVVGTYDGQTARTYVDGELAAERWLGLKIATPVSGNPVIIGGRIGVDSLDGWVAHVAVYEHALAPSRVRAHWQAGAERGFPAELAGERVAAAADSPLWSTAKIQDGHHEVQATMMFGQPRLDAVREAVAAEQPISQFDFDGVGDPVYRGWDYHGAAPYNAVQATFGDADTEIPYSDVDIAYDDEIYNDVTTNKPDGVAQQAEDTASQDEFYRRAHFVPELIHTEDASCLQVSQDIIDRFSTPQTRVNGFTLDSIVDDAREQLLTRQIGDRIRVKRRPHGATPAVDVITRILGFQKQVHAQSGLLTASYSCARGFNATADTWRLGVVGFTELDSTTILA